MIKAIIFDLGGVLMTDVPLKQIAEDLAKKSSLSEVDSLRSQQADSLRSLQVDSLLSLREEIHAHLYPTKHWDLLTLGKITEDEYWDNFLKASKISEKLEVKSEKLKEELKKKVRSSLYPLKHSASIVNLLKENYKLAILSNHAKEWSEYMKEEFDLFKSFDDIIFSCDVGLRKPDLKIYEIALDKLKCDPDECIFIDDKKRNTDAAEKLGIKGIVFEEFSKLVENLSMVGVKIELKEGSNARTGGI
jgi:epoxide hydrolase-like predicted phosphatase